MLAAHSVAMRVLFPLKRFWSRRASVEWGRPWRVSHHEGWRNQCRCVCLCIPLIKQGLALPIVLGHIFLSPWIPPTWVKNWNDSLGRSSNICPSHRKHDSCQPIVWKNRGNGSRSEWKRSVLLSIWDGLDGQWGAASPDELLRGGVNFLV